MKKILAISLMAMCFTGCMTAGGRVIGPCSYVTSLINEPAVKNRAVAMHEKAPQIVRAWNTGMTDKDVSVAVGVDLIALKEAILGEKLSPWEMLLQTVGVAGDVALGVFAVDKGMEALETNDDDDKKEGSSLDIPVGSTYITGSGNVVQYNFYSNPAITVTK